MDLSKQNKPIYFGLIPKNIKKKYIIDETVPVSGVYECSVCENFQAFRRNETFVRCEDCVNNNREEVNFWYTKHEFFHFLSKNINLEFDRLAGFQIKAADKITEWAGSLGFVYFHMLWFAVWVFANLGYFGPKYVFDPFPYGLLTMIVSLEAIFLATFIMISQNISGQKSELRAENDYQVNLNTEREVAEMHALIKNLKEDIDAIKENLPKKREKVIRKKK
jgi:uncharacterized membrane protein